MSGGVVPAGEDISAESDPKPHTPPQRFLSFNQLNALAVATVLSASGMVAPSDLAFAALSLAYTYLLAALAFPSDGRPQPPVFGPRNPLLTAWVAVGALLGLLLPVAYILHGVFEGDKDGIRAAAPHVFLLACQIFAEGVTFTRRFSLPIRAFVPIFYSAKRLVALDQWVRDEIGKAKTGAGAGVGLGLAVANLVFWGFNLFGFLLPVYLPRALKQYCASSTKHKM